MALANKYSYVYEDNPDYSDTYVNSFIDAISSYGLPQSTVDSIIQQQFGQPVSAPASGALSQASSNLDSSGVTANADTTRTGALSQATNSNIDTEVSDNSLPMGGDVAPTSTAGNVLSGNILAGASWNSTNQTLADQLTAATGQQTLNTAVGGATTADTLQQLNDFTAAGGSFAPGSTVFLQTGGVDMLQGIDDDTIRSNIDQIVSTLEDQGVRVVLTTSPRASSLTDVVNNNFDTGPASFYSDIAASHSNVALVDTMGQILQDKSLLRDALHTNAAGEQIYNDSVIAAYQSLTPLQKTAVSNKVAASNSSSPVELAEAIDEVAGTNVAQTAAQAANTVSAEFAGKTYDLNTADVNKVKDQILGQGTTSKWTGEGFGSAEANAEAMAKNLVASGVTDINQVGQKTITTPGYTYETESGTETVPDSTRTVLVNKLTGEQLISDYGERTQDNAWSGTYAGSGNTAFRTAFDAQGRPVFYTTGASSSDVGDYAPLLAIAQFIPGVAPFAMAAQAAIAIDQGDVLGGLASMAGLGGYTDAATALRVTKALDQGDMGALAMSLLQNDTVGKMAGSTMLTDTISLADAGNAYNVVNNVAAGNYAGALTAAGALTGSSDVKTAGAALNLVNAVNSGNEVAIINAAAGLNNTIKAADNLSNASVAKSVTNSVTSGADAFVQAKNAGATDADALDAANAVTGTGTSTSTTTNTQVTDNRAQNTLVLGNADADTLDEAAALAISKGNDSFTIGGKTYIVNKATGDLPADEKQAVDAKLVKEYVKSLGKTDLNQLTEAEQNKFVNNYDKFTANGTGVLKAATLADVLSGNSTYSAAESFENSKYTSPFKVDISGVGSTKADTTSSPTAAQNLDTAGNDLVNWANTLEGTSGDVIRQTLSTLIGAGGEQVADLGTALANMGVAERYNLLVQLGQSLERTGQSLEIPAVTEATKNFVDNIQNADTYAGKIAAALKTVIDQPLVLTQVAKEGLQEILPLVTGGTMFKLVGKTAGIAADALMNAAESMGSSSRQKFNEEIAKGTSVEEAEKLANTDGWKAFAITAVTAGVMDTALINKYEKAMEKAVGKTSTSFGKEAGEEGWEELAIALATGDDLATALSKSVMGSVIGAKTSGTLTAGSNVSQNVQQAFAEQGLTSTDGTFRPETIRSTSDTGTTGTAGTGAQTTVTEVTTGADTSASTDAATDFASIFESTGNTTQAVDSSVSTAISNGANVDSTISSVVSAANTTGANVNTAAATAANAAVAAGADATTASNAATTAVSNATTGTGTNTGTATTTDTGTNTGTATTTDTGTNTGTATTTGTGTNTGTATTTGTGTNTGTATTTDTGTNTGTATNTGTNTNTNTGTDTNSNTSTNANTGVTTNTTVDTNTNTTTTTTTNANTNTNTTVSTNTNTGVTTTTNTNNNTGIDTNTTVDTNTNTTTSVVTDTNTNVTVTINTNTDTGEVTSVDGPVTVINKDVVKIGDTVVNINTGEVLDPSVVTKTTPVTKTPTTPSASSRQVLMGGPSYTEPTYAAKDHDISETWLGGRFRNIAPLAGMGILMPESTPMFQETQALSALRRAAGIDDGVKTPEADYYAYGTEPSYSKVLEPFMRGGTVQNHADGGKIMASPLMAASGGDVPHKGSHYVQGAGGGQDDLIPAKLADGEYVFDAEIVAALGDGSNKEGAKKLDAMREAIRKHKRGGSLKSIPPKAKSPLAYLKGTL